MSINREGAEGNFLAGWKRLYLHLAMITKACVYIKIHQALLLRFVYFTICKIYLNLFLKYPFCLGEILDLDVFDFKDSFYL